ncbi:hypothetical protein D3C72_546690 [compost metagenome]
MGARRVEGAGLDQTFDAALVAALHVDLFAELVEVREAADALARGQDGVDGAVTHVLDGREAEADGLAHHREVLDRLVDVRRHHLDAHLVGVVDVELHLLLGAHDRGEERAHVLDRVVRLEVSRAEGDHGVGRRVRLVEAVGRELLEVVEERLGLVRGVALLGRAVQEDVFLLGHFGRVLLAHRAAQQVGLPQAVARVDLRDQHDLLLVDAVVHDHAVGDEVVDALDGDVVDGFLARGLDRGDLGPAHAAELLELGDVAPGRHANGARLGVHLGDVVEGRQGAVARATARAEGVVLHLVLGDGRADTRAGAEVLQLGPAGGRQEAVVGGGLDGLAIREGEQEDVFLALVEEVGDAGDRRPKMLIHALHQQMVALAHLVEPQLLAADGVGDDRVARQAGAVGVFEDRLERVVGVLDLLAPVLAVDELIHHARLQRARAVEGQQGGQVFEVRGLQAHHELAHALGFQLEDAHGVARAKQVVRLGVVHGDGGPVDVDVVELLDEALGLGEHGQVAQAQEVHLEQAHHLQVLLLVLRGDHAGVVLAGALQGHERVQRVARDHHTGGVDAGVADVALHLEGQRDQVVDLRVFLGLVEEVRALLSGVLERDAQFGRDELTELVGVGEGELQHAAGVLDGGLRAQRAEGDDLGDLVRAVLLLHVLDDFAAALDAEVHVDIGHAHALGVQEALEQQVVGQGVDVGDAEAVGHDRAGGRATARAHLDAVALGPVDEVPHDEEVAGEAHALHHLELVLQTRLDLGRDLLVALVGALPGELRQVGALGVAGRQRVLGQLRLAELDDQVALRGDLERVGQRVRDVPELLEHLLFAGDVERARLVELLGVREQLAGLDAHERVVGLRVLEAGVVGVVRRHVLDAQVLGHLQEDLVDDLLGLAAVLVDQVVVLELQVEVVAFQLLEPAGALVGRLDVAAEDVLGDLRAQAAREEDDALGVLLEDLVVHAGLVVIALEVARRDDFY